MFTLSFNTRPDARYAQRFIHTLAAGLCSLLLAPAAWSAPLAISDSPLFLASGVRPNVFIELDDSGSMDWEILTRKYWSYCEYDRNALIKPYDASLTTAQNTCDANMLDDGLWLSHSGANTTTFEYIYNNSDAAYDITCDGDDRQALYECNGTLSSNTPYQNDWRILSSDFNVLYYNPKEAYLPWLGPCMTNGTACGDAAFSSARSNPREGTSGYTVTRNLDKFTWETWVDNNGYDAADGRPLRGVDINFVANTTNGIIDLWDSHSRFEIDGNKIKVTTTTYAPNSTGLNPTTSTSTLSGSDCHPELASNTETCRSIAQVKQNVANWYQYARKRQFVAKGGISAVINKVPSFRYGLDTINQSSSFIEVPGGLGNYSAHNDDLLDELFSFAWPTSGTPLRQGLQRAGDYFDNDGANNLGLTNPIEYSCQKNFSVLITDGYWNGDSPNVGNVDGDTDAAGGAISDTVADVARLYYNHDLDTDMANDVEPDKFDSATYQHLATYTLAFGVEGKLVDTDTTVADPLVFGQGLGWPNPALAADDFWGDPNSCDDCAEKIDDLWHAAYNSHGTFVSASTSRTVIAGLKAALLNIESRSGTASSVALSSGALRTDTKLYQAKFTDTDWQGELLSIPILDTPGNEGVADTANAVDAGVQIQAAASRIMMTHNGTEGVLFKWTSGSTDLSVAQQNDLNTDASGNTDTLGIARLAWLRGDQSNDGGIFRNRPNSLLGDIINSAPNYVGPPQARYPLLWSGASAPENLASAQTYLTFKQTYQNRTPIVYVGTNGGTLNGFDADFTANPIEKLAYVPGKVFENLSQLMDPGYTHNYYVDGSPTVIDAFFSSDKKWHTVLAGGLNRGGQGIYALDITNPAGFADTNASAQNVVLWEFTDTDSDPTDSVIDGDADLGFSYSRPAIVRLHNGKWAAIFGNGYNNTDSDGNTSTTGHAVLFIVDIETGALIKKIDTEVGSTGTPNGLATPAVVDINGDFIADIVYAGDLEGNLWKFDITDASPANWDVAFHTGGGDPEPLYVTKDGRPITVRPEVGRRPDSLQAMLYFGTGMYLQTADLSDTSGQTFYGIIDDGTSFTGRGDLAEQTVDFQGTFSGTDPAGNTISTPVRVTSNEPADTRGWFMDLPDQGERNVSNPILRAGRIIFVTVVPDTDLCNSGGSSWLMELDALSGGRLDESPFDLNNDGFFNLLDYVNVDFDVDGDGDVDADDRLPASGKGFESLIPTPGILSAGDKEYKYTPDSSGGLERTTENPGKTAVGRQSWGQLR